MSNIKTLIGEPALLEQLAEECNELAQVALKKARRLRGENPTPKTIEELDMNLIEEFTDVLHCARELDLDINSDQIINKQQRWLNRIKEAKEIE